MMEQEHWVSANIDARHLGIGRETANPWIVSRVLPAHCIVRLWKIILSDIDEWGLTDDAATDESEMGGGA